MDLPVSDIARDWEGRGKGTQMSNSEYHQFCAIEEHEKLDLYPEPLKAKIEDLNSWVIL